MIGLSMKHVSILFLIETNYEHDLQAVLLGWVVKLDACGPGKHTYT